MSITLVTGATGFVGNNVVRLLVQRGEHVRVLVRESADSRPLSTLPVEIVRGDVRDQSAEIGKDPAKVFGHEIGGHTADVLNAAEGNANQFIDGVKAGDESSSEAAEKAMGKVPNQPSQEDVQAVEEILKPKEEPKKEENPQ